LIAFSLICLWIRGSRRRVCTTEKNCLCRRTFIYKNIFHYFQRASKGPTCFRGAQYELNEIGFGGWRGRIAGVTFSYTYLRASVTRSPNCVIDSILSTRVDYSTPLLTLRPNSSFSTGETFVVPLLYCISIFNNKIDQIETRCNFSPIYKFIQKYKIKSDEQVRQINKNRLNL